MSVQFDVGRSISGRGKRRKGHRQARLRAQQAGQHGGEIIARARVAPVPVFRPKMETAGARGDPQLAVGQVAIDDYFAAVGALDFENTQVYLDDSME